jgi:hypothetical protein
MESMTATFRNGRLELAESVDWPEGTLVQVTPLGKTCRRVDWLSLSPLEVGEFCVPNSEDDLLAEMLDDVRA